MVLIEHARQNNKVKQFQDNSPSFLINQYYFKAEKIRKVLERKEITSNLKEYGDYVITKDRVLCNRTITEQI